MKKYNPDLDKKAIQRNKSESTVKNAISELLDVYKLKKKFSELEAMNAWMKVLGNVVAKRTTHLQIKEGILYVKLESASLKNELMMAKSSVIEKLNQQIGGEKVIQDIIFN